MNVFLAGAAGVIGRRLTPLLVADGHVVVGTTRTHERGDWLAAQGALPVLLDVFDAPAVMQAVMAANPDVVIHQLTDLADIKDPARVAETLARNAKIRDEGTRNLLAAAHATGAKRVIAQSISFAYAPGQKPFRESDPLNVDADGSAGVSARGVASLERQVSGGPWTGIVLRYGRLYGPGAPDHAQPPACPIETAAEITRRAVTLGNRGIYNVGDDEGVADVTKARAAFGVL